eukprot:Polyplicarium_translucidae@DN1115_c0_g1_i3.p4
MPSRGCLIGTQTRSMRLGSTAGLAMLVGSAFLLASSTAMTKVATSRFGIPALHAGLQREKAAVASFARSLDLVFAYGYQVALGAPLTGSSLLGATFVIAAMGCFVATKLREP